MALHYNPYYNLMRLNKGEMGRRGGNERRRGDEGKMSAGLWPSKGGTFCCFVQVQQVLGERNSIFNIVHLIVLAIECLMGALWRDQICDWQV